MSFQRQICGNLNLKWRKFESKMPANSNSSSEGWNIWMLSEAIFTVWLILQGICMSEGFTRLKQISQDYSVLISLLPYNFVQIWSFIFILISVPIFYFIFPLYFLFQVLLFACIWSTVRCKWDIYPFLYSQNIIEDQNAFPGSGLAVNYWDSFLNYILKEDLSWRLAEEFGNDLDEYLTKKGIVDGIQGLHLTCCHQLVILLPLSCDKCDKTSQEGLFAMSELPTDYFHTEPSSRIKFRTREGQADITLSLSWIYQQTADEEIYRVTGMHVNEAEKIYFLSDFPSTLYSSFGPNKCRNRKDGKTLNWSEKDRKLNLDLFQSTINCLAKKQNINNKLMFCSYSGDDGRPASYHIRQSINQSHLHLTNSISYSKPSTQPLLPVLNPYPVYNQQSLPNIHIDSVHSLKTGACTESSRKLKAE
ncbi:uncharacterized protein LOC111708755 [Eurytemora carolleeae]|uniref:uncharacterized protein LOC111708755 n=1 Tax=Eurytemora carolleeae TaxID=1294199 RepID=UPI000C791E3B|nr:uncharacterized protein LOC111708755 [Eurytemora carolleeae]|eukprot:XP_023337985.1 uncharacterized protein LOC111708755 [Eurytemora affinis]